MTLDEVQREPDVLRAVKRSIDRNRSPGRLLLTGAANLLLMRGVSQSLAGRASSLTLWPMTRREQRRARRIILLRGRRRSGRVPRRAEASRRSGPGSAGPRADLQPLPRTESASYAPVR
ncbi:MAG: AAA family ATPase [Steroidobacteraceae bacterium]